MSNLIDRINSTVFRVMSSVVETSHEISPLALLGRNDVILRGINGNKKASPLWGEVGERCLIYTVVFYRQFTRNS
jgi:hypothetical protein